MSADTYPSATTPRTIRVVVGYDGSTSSRTAMEAGAARARALEVPLLLVCSIEMAEAATAEMFLQSARDTLAAAADRCRTSGVQVVRTATMVGSATAALLEVAEPGDLLVVGTHGHRPVARVLLGSTSSSLVTLARQPVLVARAGTAGPGAPVVVGVDGSASSVDAVQVAAREADRAGVPLRAVIAVPPVVDAAGFTSGPDHRQLQEAEAAVAEALAGLPERYPDLQVERVVTQTHPVVALVRASRQAALVVLGSRGRGTLRSVLLGSVSREVVQRADAPVLVVHPVRVEAEQSDLRPTVGVGR